jgi:hypothetical protein
MTSGIVAQIANNFNPFGSKDIHAAGGAERAGEQGLLKTGQPATFRRPPRLRLWVIFQEARIKIIIKFN